MKPTLQFAQSSAFAHADPTSQADASRSSVRDTLRGRTYEEQVAALSPEGAELAPEEAAQWGWMDTLHASLDVAGLIPLVGEVADAANALIYLAQGQHVNAGLSLAAMVPVAGIGATGVKAVRTGKRAGESTSTGSRATGGGAKHGVLDAAQRVTGRMVTSLPRPPGLSPVWTEQPSKSGGGTKYQDPGNPHHVIRVMPGNPHSPFPSSQRAYVRHIRDGQCLNVAGQPVDVTAPEAHIPLDEFVCPS